MKLVYLFPLLILIGIPSAFAYRGDTYTDEVQSDGSHIWIGGLDPYLESGSIDEQGRKIFIPYQITETTNSKIIETGGISWKINKNTCTMQVFNGDITANSLPVISDVSYTLQQEIDGIWTNTNHNSYSCQITITESNDTITVITRQGDNTIGFKEIEYKQIVGKELEVFLRSPVDLSGGKKYGFAESHIKSQNIIIDNKIFDINSPDTKIPKSNMTEIIHGEKTDQLVITENQNGNVLFNAKDSIHNTLTDVTIQQYTDTKLQTVYDYHETQTLTQGERLEIDPTFGYSTGTHLRYKTANGGGTCSSTFETSIDIKANNPDYQVPANGCYFANWQWDLSTISDTAIITDTKIKYSVSGHTGSNPSAGSCDFVPTRPHSSTGQQVLNDILGNTPYVDNNSSCASVQTDYVLDLGSTADTDVATALTGDEKFNVALKFSDITKTASDTWVDNTDMKLQITYGAPCTAVTNLKTNTQSPSQINLIWSPPNPSCSNTNYKIFKSVDGGSYSLHTTLGNVTLANITGLDSARQYTFKVSTNSTFGYGTNATSPTNSTTPDPPLLTSLIPASTTKINVEFSDNSDGSDIDWKRSRYALYPSGTWINFNTNSSINTPRFENFTGLSQAKYNFQIAEGNNGGWSDWSSNGTARTFSTTSGTLTFVYTNVGDAFLFNGTLSNIIASPSPQTATHVKIIDNGTITQTKSISNSLVDGSSASITYIPDLFADNNVHAIKLRIITTNNTGTVTIDSAVQNIQREYGPDYFESIDTTQGLVNYTIARVAQQDQINLKVNRDKNLETFNVECLYRSMTEAALGGDGTWHNYTSVYFMNDTLYDAAGTHYYIDCYNDGELFTVVSYTNSSMLLSGIEVFDNTYGTFIGVPVGVFFIVLVAGMANQRTAPMWIVVILAIAGIMSAIGFFTLETNVWALALIAALLGIIVGRKLF